jgi:hypothetical protein
MNLQRSQLQSRSPPLLLDRENFVVRSRCLLPLGRHLHLHALALPCRLALRSHCSVVVP